MRIVPVYDVSKEKAFLFMLKKYMLKKCIAPMHLHGTA